MGDMWCSGCDAESLFERVDCTDHGADCPELVCTGCGTGIELAPLVVIVPAVSEVAA